uniref:transmembrane protein 116 isoform X1 n=1 Tax=Myxine glutinosa TaxID=7769 RepID=UPI00358DF32A
MRETRPSPTPGIDPLDGKVTILAVTYAIGSSVSILGTLSILLYLCRHASCQAPLLFQLCLADFIASVLLLYSSIMQLVGGSTFYIVYSSCQYTIYFVFVHHLRSLERCSALRGAFGAGSEARCCEGKGPRLRPTKSLEWGVPLSGSLGAWRSARMRRAGRGRVGRRTHYRQIRPQPHISQCFYACTFCLAMIYSYEVYHRSCSGRSGSTWDRESSRRHLIILYVLSWGVPIGVYVGVLLHNLNHEYNIIPRATDSCTQCLPIIQQTSGFCFKTHHEKTFNRVTKAIFMIYFVCVTILCSYFYSIVRRSYNAALTQRTVLLGSSRERETTYTTLYFQLYFLFCWSPVMLLCILSYVPQITNSSIFVLHLLQAITMPLQGAMISLVYGWFRRSFRHLREMDVMFDSSHVEIYGSSLLASQNR